MKKTSLTEIGTFFRDTVTPATSWVCMDMDGIHIYDASAGADYAHSPNFNHAVGTWDANGNKEIATLHIAIKYINIRNYTMYKDILFSKCIECVNINILDNIYNTSVRQKKAHNKSKVIAYFVDGSTILFDSKVEAKNFFGLKRTEQINRYIESGNPLPDGTTTIDEACDDAFVHKLFNQKSSSKF